MVVENKKFKPFKKIYITILMSTEERVINDDIFVPEFKAVLDTLDAFEKRNMMKSIFYNPHAPQNVNDPMTMTIILNFAGMSKERYKICRKYGYFAGGSDYYD